MSVSVYGHIVELDKLAAIIGSKDKKAVGRVAKSDVWGEPASEHWKEIDQLQDDAEITCREALEDMVFGRKTRRKHEYLYIYALETLCRVYGRRAGYWSVNVSQFERAGASWLDDFNSALTKAGVVDVLSELYKPIKKSKAMPLPISTIKSTEWPYAALVPRETCSLVRESILAGIGKVKPEFREAALEIYRWVGEVNFDCALALFYY